MPRHELDAADRRILRELQHDGALRNDVLSERVALTPAPTLRRVRALESAGVISRYAALLDPERVGLGVRVKVDVRLASQTRLGIDAFSNAIMAMPEVIECMILFGEWDYVLTVVAHDVEDYQRFVFSP
jgi:Lrp/AsnC family leucine-responsive transcriptional regulator